MDPEMTNFRQFAAKVFADLQQSSLRQEEEAAKADPHAHRTTRVFSGRLRWRYYDGGKGLRFCYSCDRNAAGYYLAWRERRTKTGGRRDQYVPSKRKKDCIEHARLMAAKAKRIEAK